MLEKLKRRLGGLLESAVRFPVTVAFLLAAAVLTTVAIGTDGDLGRWILTCAVGAMACAVAQTAWERFLSGTVGRILLTICGLAVAALFYLSVAQVKDNSTELLVRPAVTLFLLFFAFVWAPVIKSRYSFADSFMAAFKALFQAVFFSGILFLGVVLIIAAVDTLIVTVNEDAYMYTATYVFIIIAPLILLSLIPVFPGKGALAGAEEHDQAREALIEKRIRCPKFLEVLLSYIIVPLASVFTLILLAYIFINIGGAFWTSNLLEPMLIAYTITVITTLLLVSRLENRLATLFRQIFPMVLIPLALFQVVASSLLLRDTGVTFGRYYVILYGVFAVLSGLVLSVYKMKKTGFVALLLVVLSAVSLVPPVDAFTVSRFSQIRALEAALEDNGMLLNGVVTPNGSIPEKDKTAIVAAIRYLSEADELDRVEWLPAGFYGWDDTAFFEVFGFHMYETPEPEYYYVSVYLDNSQVLDVSGYDFLARMTLPYNDKPGTTGQTFTADGQSYSIKTEGSGGQIIVVSDETGRELFRYDTADLYARYEAYTPDKNLLTPEDATFVISTAGLDVKIIVMNLSFSKQPELSNQYADLLVLIRVK